jgi:hypothetical protein
MFLIWNGEGSYKKHLEDMKIFRRFFDMQQTEEPELVKDMPVLFGVKPPQESGLIRSITDKKGKVIFVPIWEITPAKGIQN